MLCVASGSNSENQLRYSWELEAVEFEEALFSSLDMWHAVDDNIVSRLY